MFKRKAYAKLLEWKNSKKKKALCIVGARQIGKTTLVRTFAKAEYKYFLELNFLLEHEASKIFSGSLDAKTLIANLTAYARKPLEVGKTLILLDEIQACPEARTAIKFLVEDGSFDYIETGSLLGVNYQEVQSYPVGYEEIYHMYPMDFEEFAWAQGVQQETLTYLENCWNNCVPVSEAIHQVMLKLFYSYIVIGGMPAVVSVFVDTHDIARVMEEQKSILELYRLDIAKYADSSDRLKIKAIFDSIPGQLNEKNRRFVLNKIDQHGRQNRYQRSFLWLAAAGVALPCYNVELPQVPLALNAKHNLFKLFQSDCGLLCASSMANIQFAILQGDISVNLGSVLENVIAQEIAAKNFALHYFDSKKYGELDFVVQNGLEIDLLEIKSGHDYKKHAALNKVASVDAWSFRKKYVFCKGNIECENDVVYMPLYMIMFYRPEQGPSNSIYELDLSALQLPRTEA